MTNNRNRKSNSYKTIIYKNPIVSIMVICFSILILTGCNLPGGSSPGLDATKAALGVQATIQAQQNELNIQATEIAAAATKVAQDVQATLLVQQSTQLAQQATQQSQTQPTEPPPTSQPSPTQESTNPPPTVIPPTPTPDFDEMMKSSNILLFEDMAGLAEVRYIRNALNGMGLSSNYVDVGDASGNFKNQLLSGTDWDLIIIGAESRVKIQGEFFVYLNDELNRGASSIIEIWAMDEIASGKLSIITTMCGIEFQKDWFDPDLPVLWPLAPEHPVFHQPNEGVSLNRFTNYWWGDKGDLIRLIPGSEATLLAGTIATEKQSYGTLASCLDGRLIIQTFSSHDYRQQDVERLWQNYIYNTLKAHFIEYH